MKLIRKYIIKIGNKLLFIFPFLFLQRKSFRKSRLTIYTLHSTSKKYFSEYISLLDKIDKTENFINPNQLEDFFTSKNNNQSYSLLTLDDGFEDNYLFAKEVLGRLNIKAIFFIIPKFSINKGSKTKFDFLNALYPDIDPSLVPNAENIFKPLSVDKIIEIKNLGHTIGMHGFKHENFAKLSAKEIRKSINQGKSFFDELGIKVNHFAYPFGGKKSFNIESNKIIKEYFDYIHLGIRGFNFIKDKGGDNKFLKRHPLSNHGKDLLYFPISYNEIRFFTYNRISLFINLFYKN